MTIPYGEKFRHTLFYINRFTKECSVTLDEQFDFEAHSTIQLGDDCIFTIKWEDCSV